MQKASLMRDAETKAILHAVYLNNVDPELYYDDAYFYVAVHIMEDSSEPEHAGLFNADYRLKILGTDTSVNEDDPQKQPQYDPSSIDEEVFESDEAETPKQPAYVYLDPVEIKTLDENDKLRRTMPIRNRWNHFYLVRFEQSPNETINLLFENDQYGQAELTFQKEK